MTTDRRTVRAEARRAAFEDAAEDMEKAGPDIRGSWAKDSAAVQLYLDTRKALAEWLARRGKGVLGPPPGGVGQR